MALRTKTALRAAAAVAVVAISALAGASRAATFSDGTFSNTNWTESQLILTGAQPSDPGASFTAGQATTGGHLGSYLDTVQVYRGPVKAIAVAHLNSSEILHPGAGAIGSLDFGFDLAFFDYPGTGGVPSYAVGYAPLIEQAGKYFLGAQVVTTTAAWTSFYLGNQTSTDFVLLNGSDHPDFTTSGGVMKLGFVSLNGTAYDAQTSTHSGLDNWSVRFDGGIVPEPAGWAMMVLGFGGIGAALRRRRTLAAA